MARRSRLRTEKRLSNLESMAESFKPGPPPRELSREEVAEISEALWQALGREGFEEFVGPELARGLEHVSQR